MSPRGPSRFPSSGPRPRFAARAWTALATGADDDAPGPFDPSTLDPLPAPARRYLAHALPAGIELSPAVELEMQGEIRLGRRWLPFAARQILRGGTGLVWNAVVGGRLVRFGGADVLGDGEARMDTLTTESGVRIAGTGAVGWDWHPDRPGRGVFFRYRVTGASFDTHPLDRSEQP